MYVGRLSVEKGVYELVEAFTLFQKNFPSFLLHIVGDGNQKKKLINLIRNKKLSSKIKLIDWKNDLSQFYKNSSIFILPSYFEGFGNVLIEALNFCLPCISTKNDGPNQILKNGKYGLLIKDNKPTSINTSLIEVIENYKFYKLKSIAGFKDIKKYHIDFIGDQYLKKIKSVLKNK